MTVQRSSMASWFQLFSVLRYRDFRLYWIGLVAQIVGQQMMNVTVGWLAYDLTGSPLTLGIINLLTAAPRIALTLVGGVLADRVNQRLLIAVSQILSMVVLAVLAFLEFTHVIQVWHLGLAALLVGMFHAFDEPSRQAIFPRLLPDRSFIPEAVPLLSMGWQVSRILAPSVAGFVIASAGAGTSFFISAVGAAGMASVMGLLRISRVPGRGSGGMMRNLVEGTRYAWGNMVFRMIMGLGFFNAVFAMGYTMMLPVFADDLGVDARGLGLLYAASGVGSVFALATFSPLFRRAPPGRLILGGVTGFVALLGAFALSRWFPLSMVLLAFVGYFHTLHLTSAQVVLQTLVPDELRGRVMGLNGLLWSLMPLGGGLLNGVAHFVGGADRALVGGAALVLLYVVLVAVRSPSLRGLRLEGLAARPGHAAVAGSSGPPVAS